MKIFLFKNTKINKNRTILNFMGNENLNSYLKKNNKNFNSNNDKNFLEISGEEIKNDFFKEKFQILDLDKDFLNYDFAIVKSFPYSNGKDFYFFIKNIKIVSSSQIELSFEFDFISTWNIWEIILINEKIAIKQGHLKQGINFELNKKKLAKNAFFRKKQLLSKNHNLKTIYIPESLINNNEKKMKEIFKFDKWLICFMDSNFGMGVDFKNVIKISDPNSNGTFEYKYNIIALPFSENNEIMFRGKYTSKENIITVSKDTKINAFEIYKNLQENKTFIYGYLIDRLPLNNINFISDETGNYITGIDIYEVKTDPNKDNGDDSDQYNIIVPIIKEISSNVKINYKSSQKLFNWEEADNNFKNDNDWKNIIWKKEQEAILNFAPFKKYEIGIYTENTNSGFKFDLNDLINLNVHENDYLNIFVTFEPYIFDTAFELKERENTENNTDYYYGERIFKLKRSIVIPYENSKWIENMKNKELSGSQNFLTPGKKAVGSVLSSLIPETKFLDWMIPGAKIGAKLFKSIFGKEDEKSEEPDSTANTGTDLNVEILSSYDFKTLKITKYLESDENKLAFHIHKYGYNLFDEHYYLSEILLARTRFNFIQLSDFETEEIFSNIPNIYKSEYLERLKSGITFWNFIQDEFADVYGINKFIFKY
ncbi:MAG: hypothetical protein HPAVJP_5640 [Candidatus Hepatoplasma vulgare]|nr:MAG: hypothetical protein HPAVJP_5640 [Candidatus Hepatoplasma sp.]